MQWRTRKLQSDDEYWLVRGFLRTMFWNHERLELGWQVSRLDYWRWHLAANCATSEPPEECLYLWFDAEDKLTAIMHPQSKGEVHVSVDPWGDSTALLEDVLDAAESLYPTPHGEQQQLTIWSHELDATRQEYLEQRGYGLAMTGHESQWRQDLTKMTPGYLPAAGYRIRALGLEDELPARAWAAWRSFHPDEPDAAYGGWEWYRSIQRMPLYRRDLDLVAEAPDGSLAGFCTIWFDDATRTGRFQPVGIVPEHQRRGVGTALISEGQRRLRELGATLATVSGFDHAANDLFRKLFRDDALLYRRWQRIWS